MTLPGYFIGTTMLANDWHGMCSARWVDEKRSFILDLICISLITNRMIKLISYVHFSQCKKSLARLGEAGGLSLRPV
jgi:hypothetical protein